MISVEQNGVSFKTWVFTDNNSNDMEEIRNGVWSTNTKAGSKLGVVVINTSKFTLSVGLTLFGHSVSLLDNKDRPEGRNTVIKPNEVCFINEWKYPNGRADFVCFKVPEFVEKWRSDEYNRRPNNTMILTVEPNSKEVAQLIGGAAIGICIDSKE